MLSFRRRLTSAAVAIAASTALAVGFAPAPASAAPAAAAPSFVVPMASIPTTCGVIFHRATAGKLFYTSATGQTLKQSSWGALTFGGVAKQPVAMAFTHVISTSPRVEQYVAALADGSLWRVRVTFGSGIATSKIASSGWANARKMVTGSSGYLYAIFSNGAHYRYKVATTGAVSAAGAISTSGWAGVKSLGWAPGGTLSGAPVDGLLVTTTTGVLRLYLVRTDTRAIKAYTLKSSGWGNFTHVTTGGCTTGDGAPIIAATATGDVYGYYDPKWSNLAGSDIVGTGKLGTGAVGLSFD